MALSLLFAGLGALFIGISLPLIGERVPPNRWYGFRTAKTLSDDEIWYAANRIAGLDLLAAGIVVVLTGLLTLVLSPWLTPEILGVIHLWVLTLAVGGATLHSFWELRRM